MAASYVAARLISGGKLVTSLVHNSHRGVTIAPLTAEELAAMENRVEYEKEMAEKKIFWTNGRAC